MKSGRSFRESRKETFVLGQQQELVKRVLRLAKLCSGLTPTELRHFAYDSVEANNIKKNFNSAVKLADKDWLPCFLKGILQSLRKAQGSSINRINAFNVGAVKSYFQNLEIVMERYKFPEANIYDVYEMTTITVQNPGSILGPT
jgi:hypothetical protein